MPRPSFLSLIYENIDMFALFFMKMYFLFLPLQPFAGG